MSRLKTISGMAAIALVGGALALAGKAVLDASRYHERTPPPSSVAVAQPFIEAKVDPSWVKSGEPNFRALETLRTFDDRAVTGLWACDGPSTFEWTFHMDETVHLLEGQVVIDYLGKRFTLEPGHTATFHAGTKAVWHVPRHAKKLYKLTYPGRLVRWWREHGVGN